MTQAPQSHSNASVNVVIFCDLCVLFRKRSKLKLNIFNRKKLRPTEYEVEVKLNSSDDFVIVQLVGGAQEHPLQNFFKATISLVSQ